MLAALGEEKHGDRARARRAYITKNEERDIPEVLHRAVDEVLKMNRAAWVAWLEHGSKEDWAERVGVLESAGSGGCGREGPVAWAGAAALPTTMQHLPHAELRVVRAARTWCRWSGR